MLLNICSLEQSKEEGISFICKVIDLVFLLVGMLERFWPVELLGLGRAVPVSEMHVSSLIYRGS